MLSLAACEKKTENREADKRPQVFTPETEEKATPADSTAPPDSVTSQPAKPATGPVKRPTPAELKTITPNQEAKRSLTNDAMKADEMSFQEFGEYMKGRIPYYRGKGDLKFENDIVRIQISQAEMLIESARGRVTFPMK